MKSGRYLNFEAVLRNHKLPNSKYKAYVAAEKILKARNNLAFNNRGFNQAILLAIIENRGKKVKINTANIHRRAKALKTNNLPLYVYSPTRGFALKPTARSPVRRRLFSPTRTPRH